MKRTGFKKARKRLERHSRLKPGKVSKAARAKRFQTLRAGTVWSQAVRQRDDHRCRRCGKRDEKNNHAHHVAPRSRRPDLKLNLDNGITVCFDCHNWIHANPIEAEALGLLSSETYEKSRRQSIVDSSFA